MHLPAHGLVLGEYSNVFPGCGMPVGEVVPLLRTLISPSGAIRVLSGVDGARVSKPVVVQVLVSGKKA